MEIKNLTCVECPMGCQIEVGVENGVAVYVKGNTCPRGKAYAENEVVRPLRVLTTSTRCVNGVMLPVKTNAPVPRDKIFELVEKINACRPSLPVKTGDVIIENLYDGVNLVATKTIE